MVVQIYYDNDLSRKVAEIGSGRNKMFYKRKAKQGFNFFMSNIYINTTSTVVSLVIALGGML